MGAASCLMPSELLFIVTRKQVAMVIKGFLLFLLSEEEEIFIHYFCDFLRGLKKETK